MPNDMETFYGISSLLDRLLHQDTFMALPGNSFPAQYSPPVQLCEDKEALYFTALIPGADSERTTLELRDNCLILRGELAATKGQHHRNERPSGAFERILPLPAMVAEGPVEALLCNGVLRARLPKAALCRRRAIKVTHMPNCGPLGTGADYES